MAAVITDQRERPSWKGVLHLSIGLSSDWLQQHSSAPVEKNGEKGKTEQKNRHRSRACKRNVAMTVGIVPAVRKGKCGKAVNFIDKVHFVQK